MGDERTRRDVLQLGLATVGSATVLGGPASSAQRLSNEIRIESEGGGPAAYEFSVSGSVRQEDSGDHVSGNRVYGHVGPDRGVDTFSYSGEITGFALAGPARTYRDGYRVRPAMSPAPDGVVTASDFPSRSGAKRLRIESEGGGFAVYEFETNGSVRQVDSGDDVRGDYVYGHVGPERGVDEFEFTGEVTRFRLAGPASVSLDGQRVRAGSGNADRTAIPVVPKREITARPGTTLVFEALARGYRGDYAQGAWYVDGERWYGPDAFYGHLSTGGRSVATTAFDSTGRHRVRAELYDEGDANDESADPVGATEWTIQVTSDGNRPPTFEGASPNPDSFGSSAANERTDFEVAVGDPEGELDRVVWWLGQCDSVVEVSPVHGERDAATLSAAVDPGCPLEARVVDESGAMTRGPAWIPDDG